MVTRLGPFVFLLAALFQGRGETPALATEFPFRFSQGLLCVEVRAPQRSKPLNFLLDSGANVSVLNSSIARELGVKTGKKMIVQGVNATLRGYMSKPFSLEMDMLQLPQHYFVVDLHKLSGIDENRVDGLLGVDFFRGRSVQIDYAMGKIRLGTPVPPTGAIIPLNVLSSGTILLSASINNNHGEWFRLDTGCASSLQWFQERSRANSQISNPSVGLTRPRILQTFTSVQAGPVCFERVPTGLHSKRIFPGEAGLIGNGLLSRYESITIDMSSGRLILGKSRPQNAPGL